MKYDTIVVGGGKFGCVIAAALSVLEGQKVLLLDDDRPMGGSKPSGGLMKPSWINMMSKKDMNEGFDTLSLLYGIDDVQLNMFGSKLVKVTAHHIQVDKVLKDARFERLNRTVSVVNQGVVSAHSPDILSPEELFEAPRIIVAGGIWTNGILPQELQIPNLYGKRGMSLLFPGQIEGFIKPWAPYKQIVAHKHDATRFWAGDGTALLTEKWTAERQAQTEKRVCTAVGKDISEATRQHGIRPFVDGVTNKEPCYCKQHKGIWVVAGGGKNGMIASAWAANKIRKTL